MFAIKNQRESEKMDIGIDLRLSSYRNLLIGSDVFLRPIFPTDAPGLFPIYTNPDKMKYFGTGSVFTTEKIIEFTATRARNALDFYVLPDDIVAKNGVALHLAFFNHKGFSGVISVFNPCDMECKDDLEIAYCGQGGTLEAAQIVLNSLNVPLTKQDLSDDINPKKVGFIATVHPENMKSKQILEKLDFEPDPKRQNVEKFGSVRNYYIRK